MLNDAALPTYLWITAMLGGDQETTPTTVVQQALSLKKHSLLRLEWSVLIKIAYQNEQISQLENRRQSFAQYIETLQLTLSDTNSHPPKNINEAQLAERQQKLQQVQQQLTQFVQQLNQLDQEIANLHEYIQDLQQQFRTSLLKEFQQLAKVHKQHIQTFITYLQSLSLAQAGPQTELAKALYVAVRHPDVEAELIASIKQSEAKGLAAKLKGWLSPTKFIENLTQKMSQATMAILPPAETQA